MWSDSNAEDIEDLQLALMFLVPYVRLNNGFSMYLEKISWNMIQENCQSLFQTRLTSDSNSFSLGLIGSIFLVQLSTCFMLLLVIYHPRLANMSSRECLLSIWRMLKRHGPDPRRAVIVDEDAAQIFFDHVSYSENGILRFSNIT